MAENDNIGLRLRKPYTGKTDNITLNLTNGDEEGLVLTGVLIAPVTLHAVLEGTLSERSFELSGNIQVPAPTVAMTGKIYRLMVASGLIRVPLTNPRMSGRLGTMYYATGIIRVPSTVISMSGNIREVFTYELVGAIAVPETVLSMSGSIFYKRPVFRGVAGGFTNTWHPASRANSPADQILFNKAKITKTPVRIPWHKTIKMSSTTDLQFSVANLFRSSTELVWHKAKPLRVNTWGSTYRGAIAYKLDLHLPIFSTIPLVREWARIPYEELDRLWGRVDIVYHRAKPIYKTLTANYDLSGKRYRSWLMPWSKATRLYRSDFDREIPWIPPKPPTFRGSTTLNLICTNKKKSDNIYLNLAVDRCFQTKYIPEQDVYIVQNEIIVTREIDGRPINPTSISISTDRDSWCWAVNMSIPKSELENTKSIAGEMPLIRVVVNGQHFVFLLENKKRSRKFGETNYNVIGRSITALLTDPHATVRTYTQPAQMSSVQLIAQELARVTDVTFDYDWVGLVSETGWILPEGTVSYGGLTPLKAIQDIIDPVGGIVVSHPSLPKIFIKQKTPFGHWETPDIKVSVPESFLEEDGSEWNQTPFANGVYVFSSVSSVAAKVERDGTDGAILAEQLVSRVYTDGTSMRQAGRAKLIQTNPNETTTMSSAFHEAIGIPPLAEVMQITSSDGDWWATIDSINLNINMAGEVPTVGLQVGVQRFMPESEIVI